MPKRPDTATIYAMRRKSDGYYFKKTKPPRFRSQRQTCNPDKLTHWTPDASEATFYTLRGVKAICGQHDGTAHREHVRLLKKSNPKSTKDLPEHEEYEIVKFVATEAPERV